MDPYVHKLGELFNMTNRITEKFGEFETRLDKLEQIIQTLQNPLEEHQMSTAFTESLSIQNIEPIVACVDKIESEISALRQQSDEQIIVLRHLLTLERFPRDYSIVLKKALSDISAIIFDAFQSVLSYHNDLRSEDKRIKKKFHHIAGDIPQTDTSENQSEVATDGVASVSTPNKQESDPKKEY
jgi:hypothetical protein